MSGKGKRGSNVGRILNRYRNISGTHKLTVFIAHINLVGLIIHCRHQICAISNVVLQILAPRAMYGRKVEELSALYE